MLQGSDMACLLLEAVVVDDTRLRRHRGRDCYEAEEKRGARRVPPRPKERAKLVMPNQLFETIRSHGRADELFERRAFYHRGPLKRAATRAFAARRCSMASRKQRV